MPVIRLTAPEPTDVRLPARGAASAPVIEPLPAPAVSAPPAAPDLPVEANSPSDDDLTLDDAAAPESDSVARMAAALQSGAGAAPASAAGPRRRRRRKLLTPFREGVLLALLALAAAFVYRAELKAMWDHRIRGIDPKSRKADPAAAPVRPAPVPVLPAEKPEPVDLPAAPAEPTPQPAPAANPGAPMPEAASPPMPAAPPDVPAEPAAVPEPDKSADAPPAPAVAPAAPAPPPAAVDTSPLPAGEAGAEALLRRLLAAVREEQVLPYIFRSDELAAAVHAYYSGGRAAPVEATSIRVERTDRSPVTGNPARAFIITTADIPKGFPVAVEDTKGGPQLDWEYFVQCRDRALARFVDAKVPASAVFYGTLERKHAFGDDLPPGAASRFHSFRFRSPLAGDVGVMVFVPKESPLAARVTGFRWDVKYAPVVELTHRDGYIELTDLKHETWHGPRRKAAEATPAPPAAAEEAPAPAPAKPAARKPGAAAKS